VEGWPPPPFRIAGRDQGRSAEEFWLRPADKSGSAFRKASEGACASAASMLGEAQPFTAGK
jgi:hypothetical protein